MNTILEQFQKKINGTFAFFDRMIIKGYLFPFFFRIGQNVFLSQMNLLLKDFSAYANQMTNDLVSYVEKMAAKEGRPLVYLSSSQISKEEKRAENPSRKILLSKD